MRVGILGLGGLGLTGARIAVRQGAEVIGIEPREEVWQSAKDRGVSRVVKDIGELKGEDLDVVVDFAGFGATTVGNPEHLKAVLEMIEGGQLEIESSDVGFDDIPEGLNRLAKGGVSGRLVARYDQ